MTMAKMLHVAQDAADLAWRAAASFVEAAKTAIAARGVFRVALSGGGTPLPAYALLALPEWRARIDWNRVQVYFSDERCVPPDHAQSNHFVIRTALLDPVGIPAGNIHRVWGELPPKEAAERYTRTVSGVAFDLILLGLGEDGHIASIFPPVKPIMRDPTRLAAADHVEKLDMWRVSLTLTAINASAQITFLVSGKAKASIVRDVFQGPMEPDRLPAQAVTVKRQSWLLDTEAASELGAEE